MTTTTKKITGKTTTTTAAATKTATRTPTLVASTSTATTQNLTGRAWPEKTYQCGLWGPSVGRLAGAGAAGQTPVLRPGATGAMERLWAPFQGSKYPRFEVSGSKNHSLNGFWDQRPSILGTWTLWVVVMVRSQIQGNSKGPSTNTMRTLVSWFWPSTPYLRTWTCRVC